jgi:hypothetical protein
MPLKQAERADLGKELARSHSSMAALLDEERSAKAVFKARKESITEDIARLSEAINTGKERRTLDCPVSFDLKTKTATVKRPDGAVVHKRPMTPTELQQRLPMDKRDQPAAT